MHPDPRLARAGVRLREFDLVQYVQATEFGQTDHTHVVGNAEAIRQIPGSSDGCRSEGSGLRN
jgi:hypothetical protein